MKTYRFSGQTVQGQALMLSLTTWVTEQMTPLLCGLVTSAVKWDLECPPYLLWNTVRFEELCFQQRVAGGLHSVNPNSVREGPPPCLLCALSPAPSGVSRRGWGVGREDCQGQREAIRKRHGRARDMGGRSLRDQEPRAFREKMSSMFCYIIFPNTT